MKGDSRILKMEKVDCRYSLKLKQFGECNSGSERSVGREIGAVHSSQLTLPSRHHSMWEDWLPFNVSYKISPFGMLVRTSTCSNAF